MRTLSTMRTRTQSTHHSDPQASNPMVASQTERSIKRYHRIHKEEQEEAHHQTTNMFLSSLARVTATKLPAAAAALASRAPVAEAAVARYASRFLSSMPPYAVDAPDGDHDLEDVEEHMDGVNRIINTAAVTEDADAITKIHEAVFDTNLFAVDAPDGEHDLEDVEEHLSGVDRIIDEASLWEEAEEVKEQQQLREATFREQNKILEHDI